jgi:dTDP-4-dehydrorhamnose reductase
MKYLVLGGAGQLAHAFLRLLGDRVVALDRGQCDLADESSVRRAVSAQRSAVVLNCAAYNQVDQAEQDSLRALTVNALAPGWLGQCCHAAGSFLVHFSTNYVFGLDAARRVPYRESDAPGPLSVYGLSKLGGEYRVQGTCPRSLVIRTCGLFGSRGPGVEAKNFVATMLRLARAGGPLRVVDDQVCTPTATDDLARATLSLLDAGATGLFHVTNAGQCSWHEFARTIFALSGVGANLQPVSSAEFAAPARRPAYSVLDCGQYASLNLPPLPPWNEALQRYIVGGEWVSG